MEATIEINRIKLYAHHGVLGREKTVGNVFEVSVRLIAKIKKEAYLSDQIDGTINYASIIDIIKREALIPSQLLENVAYRIKRAILNAYPDIVHGTINVAKLLPPIAALEIESVAVEISW